MNYKVIIIDNINILKYSNVVVSLIPNVKNDYLDIVITKTGKTNRKNININEIIDDIIYYVNNSKILGKKDSLGLRENVLDRNKVKHIELRELKIENKDIEKINLKFPSVKYFTTHKCTYYKNCNLGILNSCLTDYDSDVYGLDMFNGFKGYIVRLTRTNIKRMNKNVLHLDNEQLILTGVDMDYELFFLTTDAPKLRKLCIYRSPRYRKLVDKDLLFISGFYNLENIDIDAFITNYDEISKLEKLRQIDRAYCISPKELEKTKEKRSYYIDKFLKEGMTKNRLKSYLMIQRIIIQNNYQEFFHKLYVPRLESVKWNNKISSKDLKKVREELIKISKYTHNERNNISREPKKKMTLKDQLSDLWFDVIEEDNDDYVLSNSNPFGDGIKYYTLNKKLRLK